MIHEFALDPEVISDWQSLRFFADNFGFSLGRMISEFPKKNKWKKLVHESVSRKRLGEVEKLKIVEKLNMIDSKILPQSRPYNGEMTWIDNAVEQSKTSPFHAIITEKPQPNANSILIGNELDETNKQWNVPTQKRVPRVATELARAVSSLLKIAKEIIFIDPYFDPDKLRYRRPLEQFLQEALHHNSCVKRIEYHVKVTFEDDAERLTFGHNFNNSCQNKIAAIIPEGVSVTFIRWKERNGGEDFHARYILTDKGGVLIDKGLDDDDDDGGQVTPIVLLSFDMYSEIWNDFQKLADLTQCTYEYDNEIKILGTKD